MNPSDPDQLWRTAAQLLNSADAEKRAVEALRLCLQALRSLGSESDRSLRANLLQTASVASSYIDLNEAIRFGYDALAILDRDGPPIMATMLRDSLARDLRKAGRHEEAERLTNQAGRILDTMEERLARTKATLQRRKHKKWWQVWKG